MIDLIVLPLIKIVFVLTGVLITVMYLVLLERKVQAWVQVRLGPMRVGYHGVLQPIADVLKLFIKEDITPVRADKWVYTLAPIIVLVPAFIAFAVIPFGEDVNIFGKPVPLHLAADLNIGLLYIVAVASIGVYGIILAGWSSNSKYPLLGSLRSSAQLISYELAVTLTFVAVILASGSLSMVQIVKAQEANGVWFAFVQPISLFIYFVAGLAETNRAPFDLPEAESELVGRLPHRVQRDAVRAVLPGRVRQHDRRLGDRDDAVLRRVAAAVPERRDAVVPRVGAGLDLVHAEDVHPALRLPVDPGHAAALPLRPAHAPRLEAPDPAGHRQHHHRGGREGGADALRSEQKLWAKQSLSTHWPR